MWWWRIGPRPHPDRAKHTAAATNHAKGNPEESERKKKNSLQESEGKTGAGLTRDNPTDQAHPITSGDQPTDNNPASQRHKLGNSLGSSGERRQDWIFDGCGESGMEILVDFSSSDFWPPPAHPLVITRIACIRS